MSKDREQIKGKTTTLSKITGAMLQKGKEHHQATAVDYGRVYKIPLGQLKPNPYQPRQVFDREGLEELAESIKRNGVMQPILIRPGKAEDEYFIDAGERRWRASEIAGEVDIPAIFSKGDPEEVAIIENVQRENLNPIELAEALQRLIDRHNYTQEQVGAIIKKGRSTVSQILSINRLPEPVKEQCQRVDIPQRTLIEIAKADSPKQMEAMIKQATEGKSAETIRKTTRKPAAKAKVSESPHIKKIVSLKTHIQKMDAETLSAKERIAVKTQLTELKAAIADAIAKL